MVLSPLRGLRHALRALQPGRTHSTFSSHHVPDACHLPSLPSSTHTCRLPHRALVRVAGRDAPSLLQGLITADVVLLKPACSLYSMMLNAQGRVLYDIIVYKPAHDADVGVTSSVEGELLLECDAAAAAGLIKLLKRYALRSNVDIAMVESEFNLWATFPGLPKERKGVKEDDTGVIVSTLDPRVGDFGSRVITKGAVRPTELWKGLEEASVDTYHRHRLQTGIAEGVEEIPLGNCFPLEYNLDYLNGVSFSKGCYVGQELTARTHHTGVVRKRVLPITLGSPLTRDIPSGTTIRSVKSGKSAGKLVCHRGDLGLALLRLQEVAKGGLALRTGEGEEEVGLTPHRPSWWSE